MKIAPFSSRRLDILPLKRAVKNVSGMRVRVCFDVENLSENDVVVYETEGAKGKSHLVPPTFRCNMSPK